MAGQRNGGVRCRARTCRTQAATYWRALAEDERVARVPAAAAVLPTAPELWRRIVELLQLDEAQRIDRVRARPYRGCEVTAGDGDDGGAGVAATCARACVCVCVCAYVRVCVGRQAVEAERKSLRNTLSVPELRRVVFEREAEATDLEAAMNRWQIAAADSPKDRRVAAEAAIRRALARANAAAAGSKRAGRRRSQAGAGPGGAGKSKRATDHQAAQAASSRR